MLTLAFSLALAADDTLVFADELPTTLLPLYARTDADARAHELIYDRLFYSSPVH
ncbi:MAG: hypothetical protein KC912_26065 [Proteobacteria bacterium]|nr:hypothetical protein [Pseudomonadota bacterium]